ncbi:MAG: hypothetical protein FWH54_04455 [Methanobrevibacter sp.]|nr:hypothetical protein [Methanobrevibacter sp.]
MSLKGLREKFHNLDAKFSSVFHKEEDGMKKPSWAKIIPTWLFLIIVLSLISSLAISSYTVEVHEELTPTFSEYTLEYGSYKSSIYYIYPKAGSNSKDVYHISYDGNLKAVLDTSNIFYSDKFEMIMDSYLNGDNEYNASVNLELTAYDSNDKKIETSYSMGLDDGNLNIKHGVIDLLLFSGSKIDFKDGILTITFNGQDQRLSDSSFNTTLQNIDHINGVIHVFNKNTVETSNPNYYNYTLNFKIPKSSINVKNI